MRIRSTKPEFWRSHTIAELEWDVRFVLKGLEAYVDDNGVGKDDVELIAADVFPRDTLRSPHATCMRLQEAFNTLFRHGLIVRYIYEGQPLIYIDRWKDIQKINRPSRGRFPRPDGTMEYDEPVSRESYMSPPEPSCNAHEPSVLEQGNRGTGEQGNRTPPPPDDEPAPPDPLTRKTGAEKARAKFAAIPSRSVPAQQIADAFSRSLPAPIETGVLAQIATQIDACLRDSIPPTAIANGLRAWVAGSSWHPSQIPKFVLKAASVNGVGRPTQKALDYDTAAEQLIAALEPDP